VTKNKEDELKITQVSVRRLKNLGNYENETLEVTAQLDDHEDPINAIQALKIFVKEQLESKEIDVNSLDYVPF
jgi:small-conductance mechanosensitive channel